MTSPMPGTDSTADELVLEPPAPVSTVTPAQAASAVRIDPATANQIADGRQRLRRLAHLAGGAVARVRAEGRLHQPDGQRGDPAVGRGAPTAFWIARPPRSSRGRSPRAPRFPMRCSRCASRSRAWIRPATSASDAASSGGPLQRPGRRLLPQVPVRAVPDRGDRQRPVSGQDELLRDNAALEQEKATSGR